MQYLFLVLQVYHDLFQPSSLPSQDWQQHQPNQQPEYYGEAGWQEHYDGGAQGSRRGRGRGRGGDEKKRWEDKWQEQKLGETGGCSMVLSFVCV